MSSISIRRSLLIALFAAGAFAAARADAVISKLGEIVISQRDKQFNPSAIEIGARQPLIIVNDDGGTVHHAYVESDGFNFDSGDQNPGTSTTIVFPEKGDFQVLCGIHPKMKLSVHVR